MLKKMVIGVTALCFMLVAGVSTANSEAVPIKKGKATFPTVKTNAPLYGLDNGQSRIPESFNRYDYTVGSFVTPELNTNTPVFNCTDQDNSGYNTGFYIFGDFFHDGLDLGPGGPYVTGVST
jgi:hypothetical protein